MSNKKIIHIFGGGTSAQITPHLALAAMAYGTTAARLFTLAKQRWGTSMDYCVHTSAMATAIDPATVYGERLKTNSDVSDRVREVINDPRSKIVFFNCALVDFKADIGGEARNSGERIVFPSNQRLSSGKEYVLKIIPQPKIIDEIRKTRKDIFLVGFKTTTNATSEDMYKAGLGLCKHASCNLVLVNDIITRKNMIVTPEEAVYCETEDRLIALTELVDMTYYRSHLTFTRSTVVAGNPVSWHDERVPASLRTAVDFCINNKAYKPFKGATVGHFAVKLSDTEFLTSIRRSNFNDLANVGLVYIKTDGPDTVLAYGAKPSVGGQSQRIIFRDHPGMDCVLHFHCPLLENPRDLIPQKSQREVECGSHECGKQTSEGLQQFGNLKAVYLTNHGPNIVFNRNIDPTEVIDFITHNFDLNKKTGGYIP